jgi:hypothetical protein
VQRLRDFYGDKKNAGVRGRYRSEQEYLEGFHKSYKARTATVDRLPKPKIAEGAFLYHGTSEETLAKVLAGPAGLQPKQLAFGAPDASKENLLSLAPKKRLVGTMARGKHVTLAVRKTNDDSWRAVHANDPNSEILTTRNFGHDEFHYVDENGREQPIKQHPIYKARSGADAAQSSSSSSRGHPKHPTNRCG